MTYTFELSPQAVIDARNQQWTALGILGHELAAAHATITSMWGDRPDSWTMHWGRLAERHADLGDHLLAASIYGIAKFPCLTDEPRRNAYRLQLKHYQQAAPDFPVHFERRTVPVHIGNRTVDIPLHILSADRAATDAPAFVASGGIDTWKVDQHRILAAVADGIRGHLVAFDLPGTGELTYLSMSPDCDSLIEALVDVGRTLTTGRVGHLGISYGGYYSARSGLRDLADAAIVLGGPVTAAFDPDHLRNLPPGTLDMIGNAMGFPTRPDVGEIITRGHTFDLRDLLDGASDAPMLVINGDADVLVPIHDTTRFAGRPGADTRVIPGGVHCAVNKLDIVIPEILQWTARTLANQP